jgi:ABC-2 type transport system ATP-binding protein
MPENCINISQLRKRYPGEEFESLCGIDLKINSGDKFGILGPNGAGKTTLILILCGILDQTEGTVSYWGEDAAINLKKVKQKIGFVPQEYAFYEELSPVQNLEYFGSMYGLSAKELKENTSNLLSVLSLDKVKNKKVATFSGGMKRKLNLAIGIIHNPSVLFLDEPTANVDVPSKIAILNFLNQLNEGGTTIVYTGHHLDEAKEFCSHIALLNKGKIIMDGQPDDLLQKHNLSSLKELFIKYTSQEVYS